MSCSSSDPPAYCSAASPELKLYQAFIFSVPVFFAFVLMLMFYLLYLRRRRANWQSMRMRAIHLTTRGENPRPPELPGIKKEVREMLPVVVFKESFLVRETQCSVCLGEYQSDDRLQKIPPCGHTFHVDCIDHWLATNTTCPLCRVSLLPAMRSATNLLNEGDHAIEVEESEEQSSERDTDGRTIHNEEDSEREQTNEGATHLRRETGESRHHDEGSIVVDVEAQICAVGNLRS